MAPDKRLQDNVNMSDLIKGMCVGKKVIYFMRLIIGTSRAPLESQVVTLLK